MVRQRVASVRLVCLIIASFAIGAPSALAYPDRPVTFLVPYAPGGGTDVYARILAEGLQTQLKQSVVVENRSGAATQIAASALISAPADGHTILMAAGTTLVVNPILYKKLSYNVDDLAPVAMVGHSYFLLLANPSVPAKTLPELIAYIKSRPLGSLSYGTPGIGTPHHLFMEMFLSRIGAKMTQVPYRGSMPALTDVVAGNIPMMIVDLTPAQQLIAEGKVRAFGITSSQRAKPAPDIPTIEEAGLPGYSGLAWNGVVTRKGTPRPVIDLLNKTISDYVQRPEITQKVYLNGIQPVTASVDEFEKFIVDERSKWSKVIADAAIPQAD